jgi:hypothetical protein
LVARVTENGVIVVENRILVALELGGLIFLFGFSFILFWVLDVFLAIFAVAACVVGRLYAAQTGVFVLPTLQHVVSCRSRAATGHCTMHTVMGSSRKFPSGLRQESSKAWGNYWDNSVWTKNQAHLGGRCCWFGCP